MARSASRSALEAARVDQQRQRLEAAAQLLLVGQRTIQPAAQAARAHGGHGGVEQREQRGRVLARQRCVDLQVAPRRRVQVQGVAPFFDRQPRDVRQRGFLRVAHVLQQRARGRDGQRQVVGAEAAQIQRAELVGQQARGARQLEMPGRPHACRAIEQRAEFTRLVFGDQQLRGFEPLELRGQRRFTIGLEHREASRGQIQPREPEANAALAGAADHRG